MVKISLDQAQAQKAYDDLKRIANNNTKDGNVARATNADRWEDLTEADFDITTRRFGKKPSLRLGDYEIGDRNTLIGLFGTFVTWDEESGFDGAIVYEATRDVSFYLTDVHAPYSLAALRFSVLPVSARTATASWEGTSWVMSSEQNADGTFNSVLCTNAHVADDPKAYEHDLMIEIPYGEETQMVAAHILGLSHTYDVAFLQVTTAFPLVPLPILPADAPLMQETDDIWIAGNQHGEGISLLHGNINNPNFFTIDMPVMMYQDDSGMAHGNSGSPAFNALGYVVSLVSYIHQNADQKFSTPIHYVMKLYEMLQNGQPLVLGSSEMSLTFFDDKMLESLPFIGAAYTIAYHVDAVFQKSALENSIRSGDYLVEFNGKPVPAEDNAGLIEEVIVASEPGRQIPVKVVRDGQTMDAVIEVFAYPQEQVEIKEMRSHNLAFASPTARYFYNAGLQKQDGVAFYQIVSSDGVESTQSLGLLLSINGKAVRTIDEAIQILNDEKSRQLIFEYKIASVYGDRESQYTHRQPNPFFKPSAIEQK